MDGEMVPWREARVHVLTHTLHYGMGSFEGIRAYQALRGTAIFRLDDHLRRLFDSAHILGMRCPFEREVIRQACIDSVHINGLSSAYIRPMFFFGAQGMGLHTANLQVQAVVAAWHWETYLGAEALERGIRVKTSSYVKHHVNACMGKAKANGHYINSMLALTEAQEQGYDEALLLDTTGYVAECSGENIFIVRGGTLYTPYTTAALEGITRDTILGLARDQGLSVIEKLITRDEVYIADEVFLTGTAAEVTPVRELDGRTIGHGRRGPICEDLQQRFFNLVQGRSPQYSSWLTPVEPAASASDAAKNRTQKSEAEHAQQERRQQVGSP